jgi:hypothetical protein
LKKLVDQLRDAATEGNWSLEWSKFNAFSKQAQAEAEKRDFPQAVRDYSRALRSMMSELRNQRQKNKLADEGDGESVFGA